NREIREIMRDKEYIFNSKLADKNINFKLLDQDVEALNFSMSDLKRFKHIANFEAFDNTVMDIITKDMIAQELSNMDLIYTIGLADYLPDRVLGRLLEKCFRTYLAKGGHLVIAHKDISKYNPLPPNWFCDWNFYSRTQKDIEQLLSAYIDQKLAITKYYRDETGVIFFADIKKKK
ncbi:MAG: hypothetical protein KKG84_03520, partial [Candidatus Omnitrophica bacterium]|nr:hypothetical protein [Candidatus Omnitrophota bacterium]